MKTVAIVQARTGSMRLPDKVMRPICGTPLIGLLLSRLSRAERVDGIVVATTDNVRDDELAVYVTSLGFSVFRGAESDVLDRYYQAATGTGADTVVRITGDCPLIDPEIVDAVIALYADSGADYASNTLPPSYPDGLDVEVFGIAALEEAWREAHTAAEREHVTPYIRNAARFARVNLANDSDDSAERWTVDEPEDLSVIGRVFAHFDPQRDFGWRDVMTLRREQPEMFAGNGAYVRNEGADLGAGQKLWRRATRVIPGGNMLLSKRAEMFLPEQWPAYFAKARGCRVWDLDGREYIDMSLMGVGTNTLGYGHAEVDESVHRAVRDGNMSTLNCPEEVLLSERLVELHPWAEMVRLARSGGEACAIAVRIARAASRRDVVAICGYHGWHDWYLATNLADEQGLTGHLLPGLEPAGVPQALQGSVVPFKYNDYAQLERIVRSRDVGVIMMEVRRNAEPAAGFLEQVRALATKHGITLVFDECTSGFRQTYGGLHLSYGVTPDIAVFGKALGNGYAITAVLGRRSVMQSAQETFISSTFWTERIGPSAALATLEVMKRERSWERITNTGIEIGNRWDALASKYELPISINGLPALTAFQFQLEDALKYRTLITQHMLRQGFLATTAVYTCLAHTPEIVDAYFGALEPVFALIRECEDGRPIDALLHGPVCHSGFQRLN